MSEEPRLRYLRVALVLVGLIFIFGIYPLGLVWPSGWTWGHGPSHYLVMILGVYAALGVFLLIASREPIEHTSLIWFTVWSSVVHCGDHGRAVARRWHGARPSPRRCPRGVNAASGVRWLTSKRSRRSLPTAPTDCASSRS